MSSDMGYRFQSATTANGCLMVCITPHTRRRDFRSKVYVFTPEEVRGHRLSGRIAGRSRVVLGIFRRL